MGRSVGKEVCAECGQTYTTLNQTIKRTIKRFDRYVCPDCAKELAKEKRKNSMLSKYGVDNPMKVSAIKEKCPSPFTDPVIQEAIKKSYKEKTGYDNPGQNPAVREKTKETCLERYGVEYPLQNKQIQTKAMQTAYSKGVIPTSKPQLECYDLLKELGYDVTLNYLEGVLSLDVLIKIDNALIDFEYDGWYWHQDKQKDCARNAVLMGLGYKIFRVKAFSDIIPSIEQLNEGISQLLNTDKKIYYIEIK